MKPNTLTRFIVCACSSVTAILSAGLATSTYAGPERLNYGGKDKQVEMVQQEPEQKWFVSIGVGTDFDTEETDFSDGLALDFDLDAFLSVPKFADLYTEIQGRLPSSNAPNGNIVLEGISLNIAHRSWDDVYGNPYRINAQFGRVLTNHLEIFGGFNYVHADGDTETGSNITLHFDTPEAAPNGIGDGQFDLVFPFETHFSDFNSYGGELGIRYLFCSPDSPIRPYVSIAGGGTFTEAIHAHTVVNIFGFEADLYDADFYHDTWVGTGTVMLGFQSRITRSFSVGVEAGIRYESTLDGADIFENLFGDEETDGMSASRPGRLSVNGGTDGPKKDFLEELHHGLNSVNNDEGDRLVVPLVFWAKYRF